MTEQDANRVLLTGVGLVTPWGIGEEAFRAGLASEEPLPAPAKCPPVDLADYLPSAKTYLDRCSELALLGAALALGDAGLLADDHTLLPTDTDRFGLALGTAYGCLDTMHANTSRVQGKGARLASPLLFMHSFVNAPASLIAIEWGLRGPGATFTDGALSAASALLWAWDLLRRRAVDTMLVGGVEALSEPLLRAVEADPELARGRQPMEAAAFLLLEREEVARARAARVRGEVLEVCMGRNKASGEEAKKDGCAGEFAFGAQSALAAAAALLAGERSEGDAVVIREVEGQRAGNTTLVRHQTSPS